jgi:cyanophycinase-like exopeptidase
MKILYSVLIVIGCSKAFSQSYTSFFTGDTTDVTPDPQFGILLAGGATDNDNAMSWFLNRSNGGDVLVIRASGADGYNDYLFSELGVDVNSVETIRFENAAASEEPYVLQQIANAEAIFIAGGDQWNYISYWKDNAVEDLLNAHVNVKQAVIGGTSAGMAILGGHYFSAENGTVYTDDALANPFNSDMTIGHQDFLMLPFLENVITDTHYDDPDRRGRHMAFLSRIYADGYPQALGIACNEYVATVIDENGIAYAYGEWPEYEEYVYFLRHGCQPELTPEICSPDQPLTWNRSEEALFVCRMNATLEGVNFFSLTDWMTMNGGNWQEWWSEQGVANYNEVSFGPPCPLELVSSISEMSTSGSKVVPTLADEFVLVRSKADEFGQPWKLMDLNGKVIFNGLIDATSMRLDLRTLANGAYLFESGAKAQKFVVAHQ